MLSITRDALEAIKTISEQQAGGLRIAAVAPSNNGSGPALAVQPVAEPEPEDAVIEAEGAQLYVDAGAVNALEGKVLDAEAEPGVIRFAIVEPA